MKVEESLNVTFDKTPPPSKTSPLEDDDLVEEEAIEVSKTRPLGNNLKDKILENNEIINIKESKSHPLENVIGVKVVKKVAKSDLDSDLSIRLRFVPDCVLSRSCVLLQKILRFVKIMRFATKDLAVCQDHAFCYKRSC
nr:hypothetical protein CTI12_AA182560 [Tanacetum cinerariifolium]